LIKAGEISEIGRARSTDSGSFEECLNPAGRIHQVAQEQQVRLSVIDRGFSGALACGPGLIQD
jgi:hypothetical protein